MKKSVVLCFMLLLMLLNAGYVTEGAGYGLLLWYNSVVPALFPFMVLSDLITASGGVSVIMAPVHFLLGRILPISADGCYVLVSGLLCGYPMGAKTCAEFVRDGRISPQEGKFLMAVCNHPSPMFILGYVYPFFSAEIGAAELLAAVYGPVILLAFLAKAVYTADGTGKGEGPKVHPPEALKGMSIDQAILSSAGILIKIGGYLMLFSILIVFLRHMNALPVLPRLVLIGAMEMTTGIRELAVSLPFPVSGAAAAAALTFGGFSGLFQTKAVLGTDNEKNAGLSIRQYFFWKLLHAALSAGTFLLAA